MRPVVALLAVLAVLAGCNAPPTGGPASAPENATALPDAEDAAVVAVRNDRSQPYTVRVSLLRDASDVAVTLRNGTTRTYGPVPPTANVPDAARRNAAAIAPRDPAFDRTYEVPPGETVVVALRGPPRNASLSATLAPAKPATVVEGWWVLGCPDRPDTLSVRLGDDADPTDGGDSSDAARTSTERPAGEHERDSGGPPSGGGFRGAGCGPVDPPDRANATWHVVDLDAAANE